MHSIYAAPYSEPQECMSGGRLARTSLFTPYFSLYLCKFHANDHSTFDILLNSLPSNTGITSERFIILNTAYTNMQMIEARLFKHSEFRPVYLPIT